MAGELTAGASAISPWMAPAIEATGAIITGATSGLFGANQARKNRAFQERMYNKQVEDNRKNWEMVNAYNAPSAVMQRLLDAGLNPALMYSDGSSNLVANSAPQGGGLPSGSMGTASFANPFQNFASSYAQMKMLDAQIRVLESQADKNNAEAGFTDEQIIGQKIRNYIDQNTKDLSIALKFDDHDLYRARIREIDNNIFQSSFMNAETANTMVLNRMYQALEYNLHSWELGERFKIMWQEVANGQIMANAAWKNACTNMYDAVTRRNLSNAQIGLLGSQIALNNQMYDFNKANNPRLLYRADILNRKYRHETDLTDQNIVNTWLRNGNQYLKNIIYDRYGTEDLNRGIVTNTVLGAGSKLNQGPHFENKLGDFDNMFALPFYFKPDN